MRRQTIALSGGQVRAIAASSSIEVMRSIEHANGWPIKDPERFARMRADLCSSLCEAIVDVVDSVVPDPVDERRAA